MVFFGFVICPVAPRSSWSHCLPLREGAGPRLSLMAGHLPWPLSLASGWHFSLLPDKTDYYFFLRSVLIMSLSSLQPKSHQSCFLLNSPWNLGIWFQGFSVHPLLFNIFFLYCNRILLSLLIWKCLPLTSLSECFFFISNTLLYMSLWLYNCVTVFVTFTILMFSICPITATDTR